MELLGKQDLQNFPNGVETLVKLLSHSSWLVRKQTVISLGAQKCLSNFPHALAAMAKLLKEKDE